MKKKQRCLIKRFSALVAALVICAALCLPCFASNNASTQKWKIVAEAMMANEQGTESKYYHISPYQNEALYRTRFRTQTYSVQVTSDSSYHDFWSYPENYPDWWRSPVPLGSRSYIQIDDPILTTCTIKKDLASYSYSTANLRFVLFPLSSGLSLTRSYDSSASSLTSDLFVYPVYTTRLEQTTDSSSSFLTTNLVSGLDFSSVPTSGLTSSAVMALEYFTYLSFSPAALNTATGRENYFDLHSFYGFYNASSDAFRIGVLPVSHFDYSANMSLIVECTAIVSYWVDANKLPAGLAVGDQFPANNDAFDSLRDELLEQFPEAAENIANGKSTLTGWNDTETVDTEVASTSMSALNAMFQNLGSFLFIISLMVFGAVVLRLFIKKAVSG